MRARGAPRALGRAPRGPGRGSRPPRRRRSRSSTPRAGARARAPRAAAARRRGGSARAAGGRRRSRRRSGAGRAQLLLLALPLADVHAGDQHARDAPLVEDRRRRPGDGQLAPVSRDPARLALGLGDAVRGAGDRHPRRELVVVARRSRGTTRPSAPRDCRPNGVAEGAVRAEGDDVRVVVGDDDEARDRVGDRVREVPLALEVDLAPLAVGDVDPARDDPDDVAVLVRRAARSARR